MSSLADLIIDGAGATNDIGEFSIETAPNRFFALHPSTCRVGDYIMCDHEVVSDDVRQLIRLLDHPRAKLTYSEAAWLFTRIKERAPALNDRYIVVSNGLVWDRETSSLFSLLPGTKTTNNNKTKERLNEYRRSTKGVGQVDDGGFSAKGVGDERGSEQGI